ncbi:DNA polymerase IV [Candidatus Daviesbacteria bacterium]|nr:DNA polymerase IV [Candidatus Daviesbacteria bacterium]
MNKVILHIDFNSYFASVEQQANPRLRGKPIGVTGGDRLKRTVLGAASIEAKKFGVKTGMQIWEAKKLCPQIILVAGDSDKYMETTKRFLNILKDYSPYLEVFSIDEAFMEIETTRKSLDSSYLTLLPKEGCIVTIAQEIKQRIKGEIGEYITCSIGISYNKLMAKLAGSLKKPDGLVVIPDQQTAIKILDTIELDEICGIGPRIKNRLNNLGIFNFTQLRQVPLESLLASFKSYGQTLYNMARGIDHSPVIPFYEKGQVKSIGHRHTIDHDTCDQEEIKQLLLKLSEMVGRRLRAKKLLGKTVHCWYRQALHPRCSFTPTSEVGVIGHVGFSGDGMQTTILPTNDGLDIFKAAWKVFLQIWNKEKIRMIGLSVSNLQGETPQNLSLLPETSKRDTMLRVLDEINDKYGEFTLQRGVLLTSAKIKRKPNPFLRSEGSQALLI